jgi:hypothetical protein
MKKRIPYLPTLAIGLAFVVAASGGASSDDF